MTLGEKLKKIRLNSGMTQKQLAEKLSVSQNAVHNWENGKREMRMDVVKKISKVFNISSSVFFVDGADIDYDSYFQAIKPPDVPDNAKHFLGIDRGFWPPGYNVYADADNDILYFVYPDNYVLTTEGNKTLESLEDEIENFITFKLDLLRNKNK